MLKILVPLISECKIISKNFIKQEMLFTMKLRNELYIGIIVDVIEDYSLIVISAKKKTTVTLF